MIVLYEYNIVVGFWFVEVFRIVDNSTVNVLAYGLSCCEIEFENGESKADDSEPEDVPLRRSAGSLLS